MKRILDPDFRYQPSFATDVRQTFDRVRREQQASAALDSGDDVGHAAHRIGGDVDGNRVARRLEGGELAVEQRRGHVTVLALRKA
jgi:hypothetical protein